MSMSVRQFLETVISTEEGWFCLLLGPPTSGKNWHEEWFRWPGDVEAIVKYAENNTDSNVYFSAHLFRSKRSNKDNVLMTHTIQADLDAADVRELPFTPTTVVETSPGRFQAYWVLRDELPLTQLEVLSKHLTYSIPECDLSGWSLGHKMRVPGTLNYKYNPAVPVEQREGGLRRFSSKEIASGLLKFEDLRPQRTEQDEWIRNADELKLEIGPQELLSSVRSKLPSRIIAQYNVRADDRSVALWRLTTASFRAGLNRNEVYWLAKHSANNKFSSNRYHGGEDLAKDVLRAEHEVQSKKTDVKGFIREARRLPGSVSEKRMYITTLVQDYLERKGTFAVTSDGQTWYLRHETGRPIILARMSDYLDSLLEDTFGLNASEPEQRYVVNALVSQTREHGQRAILRILSRYNTEENTLMLHGGRGDVWLITAGGVRKVPNGYDAVLFPWRPTEEPFEPTEPITDWAKALFEGHFENLDGLKANIARTLFRVWILFLLFRDSAVSRPILALFGQPGSGKSTLFRTLYILLYGPEKALGFVTTPENFDFAIATEPFVVLDNVDTWTGWLPDRLSLAASTSEIVKRKLYTDADVVVVRRQGLLGISAHNPRFGREDVVDRLLMLSFHRLSEFRPESEMLARVHSVRNRLWGGIALDVQRVLQTPKPAESETPKFRITDFARIGYWIATALDCTEEFREGLSYNQESQIAFSLGEEDILIEAIQGWLERRDPEREGVFIPVGQLWSSLQSTAPDPMTFMRTYKNAVVLGKKLWSLQPILRQIFDLEVKYDSGRGARLWRIDSHA